MRRFVIVGHKAVTSGDFKLDDMAGGAGRLDILLRCINSAFFLSHKLRRDVEVYLVLQGPPGPHRTVRLVGNELKYLNPDERSTGALVRNALLQKGNGEQKSSPGSTYRSGASPRSSITWRNGHASSTSRRTGTTSGTRSSRATSHSC